MRDVQANQNYLLNEWDPIGAADLVSEERDCMIGPLISLLNAGRRGQHPVVAAIMAL